MIKATRDLIYVCDVREGLRSDCVDIVDEVPSLLGMRIKETFKKERMVKLVMHMFHQTISPVLVKNTGTK